MSSKARFVITLLGLCWSHSAAGIEHSQIFSLHAPRDAADLAVLQEFRVDAIGWGSANDPNIAAIRKMGIRYHMALSLSVWGGKAVEDANTPLGQQTCVDFCGQRIEAVGTGFPGARMYRLCTRQPGWNFAWLKQYALQGMQGFQMDCPIGSNGQYYVYLVQGACYCDTCVQEFRTYLADKYTPEQLADLGVSDVSTYDHRDAVSAVCENVGEFAKKLKSGQIPLGKDFLLFQMIEGARLGRKTNQIIRQSALKSAVLTANAWYMAPYNLYAAEFADYFLSETHYHAGKWSTKTVPHSLARMAKIADAVGKPVVCAPSIDDMKTLKKRGYQNPNEMALWAAGSYALGAFHTAPILYSWAGPPHFQGDPQIYAPIYQWIKEHGFLFDGYESWDEGIALVYDNWAYLETWDKIELGSKTYRNAFDDATSALVDKNLQFKVVVVGDPYFYTELATKSDFATFHTVVLPTDAFLYGTQKSTLDDLVSSGTSHVVKNRFEVNKQFVDYEPAVLVDNPNVWAFVRKNPKTGDFTIHLLNKKHDHETDIVSRQQDFQVSIRMDVLGAQAVSRIELYAPEQRYVELQYEVTDKRLLLTVPDLHLWDVIHLVVDGDSQRNRRSP